MKALFKWLFRLVAFVVLLVVAAVVFRNPILKSLLEWRLGAETGLDARIGYLHLGLMDPVVRIEDVKLYSPADFGGSAFVAVPEFYAEYDRGAAFWRNLRFTRARLNIAELNVVENRDGRTNLELFLARQKQPGGGRATGWRTSLVSYKGIDNLSLSLGRVRFTSLKNPIPPKETALDVKDAEMKNVKSTREFTSFVLDLLLKHGADFLRPSLTGSAEAAGGVNKTATNTAGPGPNRMVEAVTAPSRKQP